MRRKIIALIEVDDDTAFQKNDDGPISYLENEMGWLEQSQIFLENAFIADEDETDTEQTYLNYLADWIFNHQGNELRENEPVGFLEWKRRDESVQKTGLNTITEKIFIFLNELMKTYTDHTVNLLLCAGKAF